MTEKGVLHFYTTGDSLTRLLHGFLQEGLFKKVYEILSEGGLTDEYAFKFFHHEYVFEGDTREGDLNLIPNPNPYDDEAIFYAVKSSLGHKYRIDNIEKCLKDGKNEDLKILFEKFCTLKSFYDRFWPKILTSFGYMTYPGNHLGRIDNGVILKNGMIVECPPQGHRELYPVLYNLYLAEDPFWTNDNWTFHITERQLNGNLAHALEYPRLNGIEIDDRQIDTLFHQRRSLQFYASDDNVAESIYRKVILDEGTGGKYGGLAFLSKFYPIIRIPRFSKEPFVSKSGKVFLRTSPEKSMPGLLHSKLLSGDLNKIKEDAFHEMSKMQMDFERFHAEIGNKTGKNELHTFFQEFIDGPNGVCSYVDHSVFNYECSKETGDIVGGKRGGHVLNNEQYDELRKIASELYHDMNEPIQLEFVVGPDDKIYIVQIRVLRNNFEKTVISQPPKNYIASGLTFSKGTGEFNSDEVLIVDSDCKSEMLLGKKALIVRDKVEFSHALALSKVLKIPSIYGTGPFEVPDKIRIKAYNREGYVMNID